MKKLIPLVAVLGAALSIGTTVALADGGETGSDRSHTAPAWSGSEGSGTYTQRGPEYRTSAPYARTERNNRVRGFGPFEVQ